MYTFFCRICGHYSFEDDTPYETCLDCSDFFSGKRGFILRSKRNKFLSIIDTDDSGERKHEIAFQENPYTAHIFNSFSNAVAASRRVHVDFGREVTIVNLAQPLEKKRQIRRY